MKLQKNNNHEKIKKVSWNSVFSQIVFQMNSFCCIPQFSVTCRSLPLLVIVKQRIFGYFFLHNSILPLTAFMIQFTKSKYRMWMFSLILEVYKGDQIQTKINNHNSQKAIELGMTFI